jgi:hypothetical protein
MTALLIQTRRASASPRAASALVADKAHEFLFVLGHSKYRGAVQGMINPSAIR